MSRRNQSILICNKLEFSKLVTLQKTSLYIVVKRLTKNNCKTEFHANKGWKQSYFLKDNLLN